MDVDLSKLGINTVTFTYRPRNKINFIQFNQDIFEFFLDLDHFNSNILVILDNMHLKKQQLLNHELPILSVP